MSFDFEFNNYPILIAFGSSFEFEKKCLSHEILPLLDAKYKSSKFFSFDLIDIICRENRNSILPDYFNDSLLINLDYILDNGSICICILGETLDNEQDNEKRVALLDSIGVAINGGYGFLKDEYNGNISDLSVTEILSLYAGLIAQLKYPLFYFRVSGGSLGQTRIESEESSYLENPDPSMEKLRKKLIRAGVQIRFYGSEDEFKKVVQDDLEKIIHQFPNIEANIDNFLIDQQHCFEYHKTKSFQSNEYILNLFLQLDEFYSTITTSASNNANYSEKIADLLVNFYRKEFSDKLNMAVTNVHNRISDKSNKVAFDDTRILIITGDRGCGKSATLANWLKTKTDENILKVVIYCQTSYDSTDLRVVLRRVIQQIRQYCGYKEEQDHCDLFSIKTEVLSLGQQLEGAFLLAEHVGKRILLVIDGIDYLGDKCATTAPQIKNLSWFPRYVPTNVGIIFTSTSFDMSLSHILDRHLDSQQIIDLNTVLNQKELLLATADDGLSLALHSFINQLAKFNQSLSDEELDMIKDWELICNPLVQKIMCRTYHCLSSCIYWQEFIGKVHECHSLVQLMRRIMLIWINLLNWEVVTATDKVIDKKSKKKKPGMRKESSIFDSNVLVQGWVPDCLSLIVMSREGISVKDLLTSLTMLGYTKEYQVEPDDIWSLYNFGRDFLFQYHNKRFLIHNCICKEIVEHTFLAIASCSSIEARSQENPEYMLVDRRCKLHLLLASRFFENRKQSSKNLVECIYHLDRASDHQSVAKLLFNPRLMLELFGLDLAKLTDFTGLMPITHRFQYYWSNLQNQKFKMGISLRNLVETFMTYEIVESANEINPDQRDNHDRVARSSSNFSQSDFAKKIQQIVRTDESSDLSQFLHNHSQPFLFFLAQVSMLVNDKELAIKILVNLKQNLPDNCHMKAYVTWWLVKYNMSNSTPNEDVLNCCKELKVLSKNITTTSGKYLRCFSIAYRLVNSSLSENSSYLMTKLLHLSKSVKSVVLNSLVLEIQSSFQSALTSKASKLDYLFQSIFALQLWTGPIHTKIGDLLYQLALLIKDENYQLRMKSEACCRRALWIWNQMKTDNDKVYNEMENVCKEVLVKLLLLDITQSSMEEINMYLTSTYDSRIIHFGANHELTRKIVPLMRLAHSLSRKGSYGNIKLNPVGFINNNQSNLRKNSRLSQRSQISPSLNFVNKYLNADDKDIDWNGIAGTASINVDVENLSQFDHRPQSRPAFTRATINHLKQYIRPPSAVYTSASSNTRSRMSCSSTSLCDSEIRNVFLHNNSSLSYLVPPSLSRLSHYSDDSYKKEKQVRFIDMDAFVQKFNGDRSVKSKLEKKIHDNHVYPNLKQLSTRRAYSANFARPYSSLIDPLN